MRSSTTIKVMTILLSLFSVIMVAYQVYFHFNEKRDTVEAEIYTYNDNITAQAVFVRDETVITYSGDGVLDYNYSDSNKVSVGNVIASVYGDEADIANVKKAQVLSARISELERAQQLSSTDHIQPESLKAQIDEKYKLMMSSCVDGDYEQVEKYRSDISQILSIYGIVTKSVNNYDSEIAKLKSELETVRKSTHSPTKEITAPETGYFVSYADGYEALLSKDKCVNMTKEDIENVINGTDSVPKPSDAAGKLLKDYSCKILMVIRSDERISEGMELDAMLSAAKETYKVTVSSVKDLGDGTSIVILDCDSLDEYLVSERVQRIELVFEEYTGLKVPREAIRFNDQKEKGVYVILGQDVQFKKIDIIYEGDDYVLSKNTSDEDHLLLYDQILLEAVKGGTE